MPDSALHPTAADEAAAPHVPPSQGSALERRRWIAFGVLGLATLMNVLDTTVANIALEPIRTSMHFSGAGLSWVINAYMLTFGGFLLLAGRLGDLFGSRRLFLIGIVVFTAASLGCGLAPTAGTLVVARAIQGVGAAIVTAVSLAIIMSLFPDGPGRARAMGIFAFIASGGGAIGAVVGGFITAHMDWHWNFLVNVPIGVGVWLAARRLVPPTPGVARGRIDVAGALTLTAGMLLLVYAVLQGKEDGWTSLPTLLRGGLAIGLLGAFVATERLTQAPLVPLGIFLRRNILASNVVAVVWAAAMFAWFFLSSLYMQVILGYDPQKTGLAFVPANVIMAVFSVWLSAKVVARFGIRGPVTIGLLLAGTGLALFALAPTDGRFALHILPGSLLLGVRAGMAFNPLFLAAMGDARHGEDGLASGLLNMSFMMGGAVGLAVLASLAAATTTAAATAGAPVLAATNAGYHVAFVGGAVAALAGAATAFFGLRRSPAMSTTPAPSGAVPDVVAPRP